VISQHLAEPLTFQQRHCLTTIEYWCFVMPGRDYDVLKSFNVTLDIRPSCFISTAYNRNLAYLSTIVPYSSDLILQSYAQIGPPNYSHDIEPDHRNHHLQ